MTAWSFRRGGAEPVGLDRAAGVDVSAVRQADPDGGGGAAMPALWPSGGDVNAIGDAWREKWASQTQ